MNLQPVEMSPSDNLSAKAYTLTFASNSLFSALVMSVQGAFEDSTYTENDAKYLVAVTQGAIAYTHPWALILDLSELTYSGDEGLGRLISVGSTGRGHEWMPTVIVTSEVSDAGVRQLLQRNGVPLRVVQSQLADALQLVERMHWSRSGRFAIQSPSPNRRLRAHHDAS